MVKVYIDGQEGTTGLKILERFKNRNDIELLKIDEDKRKDADERKKLINSSDFTFLCLPDAAAREAVAMAGDKVRIIDASTAHRTNDDWAYGFPELSEEFEKKIINSNRIAVPGCYASGFISLVEPLVKNGIINKDLGIMCHAVSGYSGAGKKGIAQYENQNRDDEFSAPREYALTQQHKHLKEMKIISGLEKEPIFCPYVCDYYSGMVVTVPLFKSDINGNAEDIKNVYKNLYKDGFVKYCKNIDNNGFIAGNLVSDKDNMMVTVAGNDERILLISAFNNLGKGASGAAVECMNIKLGVEKTTGLDI